jgi:hypothetical protein
MIKWLSAFFTVLALPSSMLFDFNSAASGFGAWIFDDGSEQAIRRLILSRRISGAADRPSHLPRISAQSSD